MAPGAPFIQFTYGLKSPLAGMAGSAERSRPVLLNLPPAHVWVYREAAAPPQRAPLALMARLKARTRLMRRRLAVAKQVWQARRRGLDRNAISLRHTAAVIARSAKQPGLSRGTPAWTCASFAILEHRALKRNRRVIASKAKQPSLFALTPLQNNLLSKHEFYATDLVASLRSQ